MTYNPKEIVTGVLAEQAAEFIMLNEIEKHQAAEPTKTDNPLRPRLKTYTAADLAGMDVKPPPYIIDDLLPVGLNTMAASPKVGKSYMALDVAYAVATGGLFFGKQADQGDVLYLDLEGADWSIEDRLTKTNRTRPETLHFTHDAEGIDSGLIDELEEWCDRDGISVARTLISFQPGSTSRFKGSQSRKALLSWRSLIRTSLKGSRHPTPWKR